MADIFKKFRGKQNSETPSGNNADPIKVAIDASCMGPTAALTFERLIAQSFAYMFVGGENVSKVDDLKGLDKKNKLTDILDGLNKINENFEKVLTRMDKSQGVLDIITKLILGGNPTGIPVTLVTRGVNRIQNTPEGGKGGDKSSNKLDIVLKGKNTDKVLHELSELAKDEKQLKSLAESFALLAAASEKWKPIDKYLEDLTKGIKAFSELGNVNFSSLKLFNSYLKDINELEFDTKKFNSTNKSVIKFINQLAKIKSDEAIINAQNIEKVFKNILKINFDKLNVNDETVEQIKNMITVSKRLNTFGKMKFKDIEPNADILIKIFNKLSKLKPIENFDSSIIESIDTLNSVVKYIGESEFNKIEDYEIDPKIDLLNVIFRKIDNLVPPKPIENGVFETINGLQDTSISLHVMTTIDISEVPNHVQTLSEVFKSIDKIKYPKPLPEDVIKTLTALNNVFKFLENKISSKELPDIKPKVEQLNFLFEEIKKIKEPKPFSENFTKSLSTLDELFRYIVEMRFNYQSEDLQDNISHIVSCVYRVNWLLETIENSKFKDSKKLKYISDVTTVVTDLDKMANTIDDFVIPSDKKIEKIIEFIQKLGDESDDSLISKILELKLDSRIKEIEKNVDALKNTVTSLATVAGCCALFIILGPLALAGIPLLKLAINGLMDIIGKLGDKKIQADIKLSFGNVENLGKLVAISALVLILAGFIVLNCPEIVVAAFGFAFVLGMFIGMVVGVLSIFGKGAKEAFENAHKIGALIAVASLCLIIGGAIVLFAPQIVIAAFAFTIVLSLFLMATIAAIGVGAKALKAGIMKDANKIALLISVCTLCLVIGGAVVLFAPQIVVAAFAFTVVLSLFLFAVIGAISLASKPLKAGAMQDAHKMAILIGICSLCLIIGGGVITMFPQIVAGVFIFTLALSTLIFGTLTPINLNSKGIARAEKSMPKLMMVMALSTAILLGAGAICAAHPEILVYGTIFSAALAIVVGGIAYVCKIIGKNQKDIFKGALVMGTIVAIVGLASVALLLTKNAIEGLDIGKFVISMGAVSLLILAWGGLSVSLGALSMIPFFWAGVGALAAIVGIINLAGLALLTTAKAMEIFSNVKPLNFGTITKNILGMISVAALMVPLGYVAPFIIVASGAVSLLAVVIGQISKVIADVASLKIPEYEGTKIVRYRKLQTSDFKDAAENVKLIVTTLGQALIDVYNQNPKIFSSGSKLGDLFGSDTIFSRVCKSVANMDMVISNIANAVKNYAALKIPIYSGTKVTGYHFLGKSDFEAASTNVKTVIKTLGQALIDLYNENSEMFQDKSIFKNDPDNTPLGMTINVTRKLGKVISSIADGVKDYANLRFPIDWNKDGKAIKWSTMKDSDVINAGNTVKNVVVTFAKALIELYNEKPEMFQDKSWFSNSASNTPLGMTINITRKLGKVIGSIADGVRDYANLRFPIDWNKDGKAIKWSKMSDSDILSAGNTVKTVVVTFAKALIDLYNEKPEMFQDKSIFSNSASNTPLGMVIAVTSKLGKVISSIADGVKEYGNLRYAVEWNKDGKPVKFQKMTDKEIADAGANVQTIVVTMAQALMKVYDDHNEWFKDGGNFLKKTDSPFTKVLKASERMGSLVGTIGTSVGKIAKLQVPIEWNKDGRPIKYETLSQKHFTMAAEGIDKIITTLGGALMNTFKNNAEMFEDGEDSLFAQGINSVATMGSMIANIAKGIQGYSKLQIIEEYDKDGKPLKIRPMKDTDFANAATNIEKIVSTLGESILTLITKKPEFFEDGADSAFGMACAAIASMGEGIGNIATGLVSYAELKIPVAFDKDGKPTDYKKLTEPDFELAGKNIATIVTTIGNSIMTTYTEHEDWFDTGWFGIASEAPFAIMINSIATMGEGIKNIAASIQSYSSLQIPTEFNEKGEPIKFKVLTNDDMTLAATNIETVVTTVANALITTYNKNSDLFKADGDEDTPFTKISKSCANLGIMMTGVASGIQAYASMKMPSSFDKNGKPTGFTEINDKTIIAAGTNIGTVITALGSAIVDVYKNNESLFDVPSITTESGFLFLKVKSTKPGKGDTPFQRVVNGISAAGTMLVSVAESIVSFSTMTKEIDIDSAKTNIETIITALGGAILGVVENSPKYFDFDNLTKISNSILTLSFAISNVANGIQKFAKLEMPEVDQATGRTTGNFIKMSKQDIIGATDNIKTVMTTIGKAISEVSDEVCGYWFSGSKVEKSMQAINLMSNAVSTVGDTIIKFGTAQMPIDWDKDGKPIKFTHFTNKMATEATSTIVTIMTTLATAINTATNSLPQEFVEIKPYHNYSVAESKPSSNKIEMMLNAITSAVNVVSGTAGQIAMLSGESPLRLTDKNGKHIGSVKMTKTVFEKASTNIKTILTCISESLSSAVSFLYGDKDFKDFAGGNINSLYESIGGISTNAQTGKIFSTINALSAMNTVLQVLASTARSWSGTTNETYWVYEGGKLKQRTRKVEKINAETASANIKSIVTTVAESLSSAVSFLYGDKDFKDFAGGNINSLYESIGGISTNAQTGKIFSTINALSAINNVLRAMASTARAWGDGTTEIYYSFSNGRLIPHERKTEKINSEDAATNIKAVVTGIASALNDAVTTLYGEKDIKDFIGSDYRSLYLEAAGKNLESQQQQTSKIFNTISALFGMSRLLFVLSGVARAWGNFTNSEIVTDSDGKITVKEGESAKIDVSKVTANITTVVTGIATALSGAVDTLYQSKDWKDIISDGFGDIFSNAKKNNKIFNTISSLFAINNLLKVLHKTVVAWSTFTSIDITSSNGNIIYNESGEQEKINVAAVGENIKTVVKSLATAVASAVNELVANKDLKEFINEDGFEINKGFNKKSNSRISNVFTALFNMNDLLKALGETARGWGSGMDVTVANVPGIGLVVSTKQREKIDVDAATTSMSTIMGTFVSMVKQITSLDDIDDISEYSTMVINSVNEVDKVLKGMTSILQTTQSLNTQYRLLGNNINIKPLIGDIKENVIALNGMNNAIAVSNGNFGSINSGISDFYSVFDISAPVRRFKHDVSSILGTIESIKNVDITSNVSKLQNGISNLNNAMGSTQAAPNFNQQTEDLSKYVKAVSGVNVKGVDSLIQLIRELNRLGVNMGNMDKLTNAITKNLSKSLSDLSKELKKLDTTMKQEAKRQTTRNEEIKRSVETVRSLMNTEMKVKVTSDSSGSNSSSGGSLDGSDSSNGSSHEPKNGEQ